MSTDSALSTAILGVAIASGNYAFFSKVESDVNGDIKRRASEYIRSGDSMIKSGALYNLIPWSFNVFFGQWHFSAKCIIRSMYLTNFVFTLLLTYAFITKTGPLALSTNRFDKIDTWLNLLPIWFFICIADFFAVTKSRLVMKASLHKKNGFTLLTLSLADIICSVFFLLILLSMLEYITLLYKFGVNWINNQQRYDVSFEKTTIYLEQGFFELISGYNNMLVGKHLSSTEAIGIMFSSTSAITSFWVLFMVLFISLVRLTSLIFPVARFLARFIDLDNSPIKVIGGAASMFILIISFLVAFARLFIA